MEKEKAIMHQDVERIQTTLSERVQEYEATIELKTNELAALSTVVSETEQKYKVSRSGIILQQKKSFSSKFLFVFI